MKKICNHRSKKAVYKLVVLIGAFLLASCNDMEDDLNKVFKCYLEKPFYLYNAFYKNDSLYVLDGCGTDVYSLPIECQDKRSELRENEEEFLFPFDENLKLIYTYDSLFNNRGYIMKYGNKTLWTCPEKRGAEKLIRPVHIVNKDTVLFVSRDSSDVSKSILLNNDCMTSLVDSVGAAFEMLSPVTSKTRLVGNFKNEGLIFDNEKLVKKIPFESKFIYYLNNGSFYSDPVLLTVYINENENWAKIQKHEIINDTLRFTGYLPYQLHYIQRVRSSMDYIFPCGNDACLYRDDAKTIEKIKYR